MPEAALSAKLVAFCRLLCERDLTVTTGAELDAARSLELVDVTDPPAFHAALRANLASSVDDYPIFERAFLDFWSELLRPPLFPRPGGRVVTPDIQGPARPPEVAFARVPAAIEGFDRESEARMPGGEGSAGEADLLTHKDFADYSAGDMARARRLVRQLAPALATVPSRRTRPASSGGHVDIRRSVRASRRHGGDVVRLAWQRRKLRKLRVVALLDVSGSMDRFTPHFLQFLHALQTETGGVRTFAFSTQLYDLTPSLRQKNADDMLATLAATVDRWSGGTSIGTSLEAFNARYAPAVVSPRTVTIIFSDGWERGDLAVLRREMAALSRRSYRVLWLNPLAGREGYQPLAAGMAAALPFVDIFLPATNLADLERLKTTLLRIA